MNKFVLLFVALFVLLSIGKACLITVPGNELNIPIFELTFGTKRMKILTSDLSQIYLNEGESINGLCATKFTSLDYYELKLNDDEDGLYEYNKPQAEFQKHFVIDAENVTLKCIDGKVHYFANEASEYFELASAYLSCKDYEWNIYEAISPHDWCTTKATSYLLGTKSMEEKIILAAVCYNIETKSLESVRFQTTGNNFVFNQENLRALRPLELFSGLQGVEIDHYSLSVANYNLRPLSDLKNIPSQIFKAAIYKRNLIVQNGPYESFFWKYENFLHVIWWHNLLYGNWKIFTDTLSHQLGNVTYDVFMGVSGTVGVPYYNECNEWKIQAIQQEKQNETIPAYIWAYLRALDESEEFVIIGYNSPFFDFFNTKETIFCKDICNEISWLKAISSTFRYSALGVIFCCTPENVRSAGLLNTFPADTKSVEAHKEMYKEKFRNNIKASSENSAENVIHRV